MMHARCWGWSVPRANPRPPPAASYLDKLLRDGGHLALRVFVDDPVDPRPRRRHRIVEVLVRATRDSLRAERRERFKACDVLELLGAARPPLDDVALVVSLVVCRPAQ